MPILTKYPLVKYGYQKHYGDVTHMSCGAAFFVLVFSNRYVQIFYDAGSYPHTVMHEKIVDFQDSIVDVKCGKGHFTLLTKFGNLFLGGRYIIQLDSHN